jgi:hypothetical protein
MRGVGKRVSLSGPLDHQFPPRRLFHGGDHGRLVLLDIQKRRCGHDGERQQGE